MKMINLVNRKILIPHFFKFFSLESVLSLVVITNSTEMPCELNSVSCPLLEKSLTWMFTPKTMVGILYENQTFEIYSKKLEMNGDTEKSSSKYSGVRFPTVISSTITPYVIHIDFYDRKFCLVLCLALIFVLSLLFLLLVLIYKSKIILQLYSSSCCSSLSIL